MKKDKSSKKHTDKAEKKAKKVTLFSLNDQAMPMEKETPGTFRFKTDDDESYVKTIYIDKDAFGGRTPKGIAITIVETD